MQRRVRVLRSRAAVYLLVAGALFAETGYRQVWARLVAGLDPTTVATPGSSAPSRACVVSAVAPLRELFNLLRGPAAAAATLAWTVGLRDRRNLDVCAQQRRRRRRIRPPRC